MSQLDKRANFYYLFFMNWAFPEKKRTPPAEEARPVVTYPIGIPAENNLTPMEIQAIGISNFYRFPIINPMEFR